ncbi:WD40-repeat-containing domain protein [Butyriboletus roseoflavus]|nr:WD40-repeat-containing domain protein [Butyriboletus roseoflavus]
MSQLDHGDWRILTAAGVRASSVGLSVDCPTCGGTVPLSICRSDRNGNGGKPLAKHPQCRFFHFFPQFLSFPNILSMIPGSGSSFSPDPASAQPSARSLIPSTLFPSSSLAGPSPSGPVLSTEPALAQYDPIRALAFLPDGRRLAVVTGGSHGRTATQTVWNLDTKKRGPSVTYGSEIWSLAMTLDGTKVISIHRGGRIKLWEVESHKLVTEWIHSDWYPEVAISLNDRLIATWGSHLDIDIYTTEGSKVIPSIKVGERMQTMCFSPDEHKLACVSVSGGIHVYETKLSGTHILGPLKGHRDWVCCLLWSHDGSRLFSGSDDKTIRCWNFETGKPIGQPWIGHTSGVNSLSLSPDGLILASASQDATIRFWDTTSGGPVRQQLQHRLDVVIVSFSPSGDFVASAERNGKIYLWRVPRWDFISDQARQIVPNPPLGLLPGAEQVWHFDPFAQVPVLPRPIVPCSTSLPTMGQQCEISSLGQFPPPPDLTPYIVRINNQYSAGGGFGDIYRCRYLHGSVRKEVAVKALRFNFTTEGDASNKSVKMLCRELGIWKRLDHINIVPFLGIAYGFGMEGSMSLVSLWMPNESLHNFLMKYEDKIDVEHRLKFLQDIVNGLHYLHSFPIAPVVHGDLNPNNVVLDEDYTARLVDFGYASLVGNIPEVLGYLQRSTTQPGTLCWSAPEQHNPETSGTRTTKSDVYSFGCVALQGGLFHTRPGFALTFLQVLSGKVPWSEIHCKGAGAVILCLLNGQKPSRPESRAMDDLHWNLIQDCWSQVEERPAAEAIIPIIEEFLRDCPRSRPLHELLGSQPNHTDSLVE